MYQKLFLLAKKTFRPVRYKLTTTKLQTYYITVGRSKTDNV